eukprot:1346737-Rhodomonas_salina.3
MGKRDRKLCRVRRYAWEDALVRTRIRVGRHFHTRTCAFCRSVGAYEPTRRRVVAWDRSCAEAERGSPSIPRSSPFARAKPGSTMPYLSTGHRVARA